MKQKKVQKGMSKFLSEIDLRYQADCCWLGNFDIDFFSPLPSPKFWNSETVNMNQNVGVNFQKQKWKLTKYIKTEWKQSIIPRNFSSVDASVSLQTRWLYFCYYTGGSVVSSILLAKWMGCIDI
jgi:hypothetical protein